MGGLFVPGLLYVYTAAVVFFVCANSTVQQYHTYGFGFFWRAPFFFLCFMTQNVPPPPPSRLIVISSMIDHQYLYLFVFLFHSRPLPVSVSCVYMGYCLLLL